MFEFGVVRLEPLLRCNVCGDGKAIFRDIILNNVRRNCKFVIRKCGILVNDFLPVFHPCVRIIQIVAGRIIERSLFPGDRILCVHDVLRIMLVRQFLLLAIMIFEKLRIAGVGLRVKNSARHKISIVVINRFFLAGRRILCKEQFAGHVVVCDALQNIIASICVFYPRVVCFAQLSVQQFGRRQAFCFQFLVEKRVLVHGVVRDRRKASGFTRIVLIGQTILPVLRPEFVDLFPLIVGEIAVILGNATARSILLNFGKQLPRRQSVLHRELIECVVSVAFECGLSKVCVLVQSLVRTFEQICLFFRVRRGLSVIRDCEPIVKSVLLRVRFVCFSVFIRVILRKVIRHLARCRRCSRRSVAID